MKNVFIVALFVAGAIGLTWATAGKTEKEKLVFIGDQAIVLGEWGHQLEISAGMTDGVIQAPPHIGFYGRGGDGKDKGACVLAFTTHHDNYLGDYATMQVVGKNGKKYFVDMEDIAVMVTEWKEKNK